MAEGKLELNPEKTKIVYCQDGKRQGNYPNTSFDFLGYTFRARMSKTQNRGYFVNFSPGVSNKAKKRLREKIRKMEIHRKTWAELDDVVKMLNPVLRGWINYFNKYYKSAILPALNGIDNVLIKWARKKYKKLNRNRSRAKRWLSSIAKREPDLFAHWQAGVRPTTE